MATEYSYMKKSGIMKANHPSGALAVADDIAFDYTDNTTDNFNNPQFVVLKTLKLKIDEIDTALDNISELDDIDASDINYTTTINGEEVTTPLSQVLEDLGVDALNSAIDSALTSARNASSALGTIMTLKSILDTSMQETTDAITEITPKINSLTTIANQLHTVFNADALFLIMSEDDYDALGDYDSTPNADNSGNVNPNTIYFCYDSNV